MSNNKTINYLIVEDEEKSRLTLLQKLKICNLPDTNCIGLASNAQEAMFLAENTAPDILLLDINLPGKNGFELLSDLNNICIEPIVIFTSAHTENHILLEAMKHSPLNFLTKPIVISELEQSMKKACANVEKSRVNYTTNNSRIKFQSITGPIYVKPCHIISIKADQHYAVLTLTEGETIMLLQGFGKSINKDILTKFPFYKADRSTLINLSHVEKINTKNCECILNAGTKNVSLTIATKKVRELIKVIDNYNQVKR
ncbi:MAG TPA: response regulator [Prolixibacteraceae bacterium]|nr:response regulator [Prolixibacteraceae bacterium]